MLRDNRGSEGGGISIGFCGILAIVFIILKLVGVISWPWVWVLAPIWIPIAAVIAILIIIKLIL